jgi:copper chaperone NosL
MSRPQALLLVAAALLIVAILLPWWEITMHAPQYPSGLHVTTWFYRVTGDVREVDGLNHYIGFMPLAQMATLERGLALILGPLAALCVAVAAFVRSRFVAALLAVPVVVVPLFFVGDMAAWLAYAGTHLDPNAALSSSVAPWTPPLIGTGGVGQFHTQSAFGSGFYVALLAAVCAVVAIVQRLRPAKHAA